VTRTTERAPRLLALALLALLAPAAPSCSRTERALPAESSSWSLVVLLLDALPASGVGAYGYPRPVTPNLDAFAEQALRFRSAYASASYTLASVSSLFTGLAPATHGVVGLNSNVLVAEHRTLAEALAEHGFATGGFSCNPHITPEGGFGQGFAEFRHYGRDRFDVHTIPVAVEGDPLDWWDAHAGERRFLYVHVLPPHQPYDAPPEHARLFETDRESRRLGMTDWLVAADKEQSVTADSEEARTIRARYDAGVHYADAYAGRLLDRLRADGAAADTVFVVLSDHGEGFAEHGRLLHGSTVFDEMVRVPLLVAWPGLEPRVVDAPVRTRDLAATLCELLDVPWRGPRGSGASFLDLALGRGAVRPAISRSVGNFPVWSLRTQEWTLVEQPSKDGLRLLFDRVADPHETTNLLALGTDWRVGGPGGRTLSPDELARVADELSRELQAELADHRRLGRAFKRRSDRTHRDEIEALGYAEDAD